MRCDETNKKMKMMVVLCFFLPSEALWRIFRGVEIFLFLCTV